MIAADSGPPFAFHVWCAALVVVGSAVCPTGAQEDRERQARLEHLQQRIERYQLVRNEVPGGEPLRQTENPLLRWSNPTRNFFSDGATFLWLDGERPVAAATLSIRGTGEVWHEFSSLSGDLLRCVHEERTIWAPESGGLVNQPLTDAPPPASSERLRLAQMRQLARDFTVVLKERDQPSELRLLPQPIYRYSDKEDGIVDGAIFAFALATDPECLLALEARPQRAGEDSHWRFTLARMTSFPLAVQLKGREIWVVKGYWQGSRSTKDPFLEARIGTYETLSQTDDKR